jgi:seryl-tRNA synthetase
MLDIKLIREQPDRVKAGVAAKGFNPELVDAVKQLDEKRRQLLVQVEQLRSRRNNLTKDQIDQGKQLKIELKSLEEELEKVTQDFDSKFALLPNLPSIDTPAGKSDKDNVEIRRWGTPRKFDFAPKDHLQIGTDLKILDFDSGSKVTGSQFYYLYDEAALLELALTQFTLNLLKKEGFIPVITPDLAKSRYYLGTGYAPKGDEAQTYTIEGQDLGLIATAEVTLAGKHADEIISEAQLPIKYVGYSHCFRQEAGAYGKYSKGLYRVHQFTKTEMFIYCLPEDSEKYHQEILAMEEKIYRSLNLPYRVVQMCSGDLGAMAAKKYDIEVWMPGREDYGEVTSTSNCTDYQARNLNIRYKKTSGETGFIHMLNGTAVVMSRVPLAIFENYQNADGSITIPEVLRPYTGFEKIV